MSYETTIAALALYGTLDERLMLKRKARELFKSRFPGERWRALTPRQRFDYLISAAQSVTTTQPEH